MVDQILVERLLADIRANVAELRKATDITWEVYQTDTRSRRFIERTLHILIEACLDIAQHIIADEQFREPANYRDAFTVLAEQKILHCDDLPIFHKMIAFRKVNRELTCNAETKVIQASTSYTSRSSCLWQYC